MSFPLLVNEGPDLCIFSSAKGFQVVQNRVADIIKGKLLVGHALHNDLKVRNLDLLFFLLFI